MKKIRWRPTKLTDHFLKVVEEVLNDDINAIIFTDEELLFEINNRLEKKEQIGKTTWKNYKTLAKDEVKKTLKKIERDKMEIFLALYKEALNKQKKNLFQQLKGDEKSWQRWAWIIERKFSEWNLRHIGEVKKDITADGKITVVFDEE